jgi:hypothetical protein
MKQLNCVFIVTALAFAACKQQTNLSGENAAPRELKPPILYLNGSSGTESIIIQINGAIVWNGVVPMGSLMPNIHALSITRSGEACEVSLESKTLKEKRAFKWVDGEYIGVNFNNDKNGMIQQWKAAPRFL